MHIRVVSKAAFVAGAVLLATTIAFQGPVDAKAIESASIDGPGLAQPIELGSGRGFDLHELADLTAMWALTPGYPEPVTLLERAPVIRLGPSYTLTWRVFGSTTTMIQEIYPHAEGGPLVYTAAGQVIFDDAAAGGWYRARDALNELLEGMGIPSRAALANASSSGDCGNGG